MFALLLAGQAILLTPSSLAQTNCSGFPSPDNITPETLNGFDLIIIGRWVDLNDGRSGIEPEVYLKGIPSAATLRLGTPEGGAHSDCPPAVVPPGSRVLAPLRSLEGELLYPDIHTIFILEAGLAKQARTKVGTLTEDELISRVRKVTGQSAVPATSTHEGISISWVRVILPLGASVLGIFVIGLVLMRIWHRIDPT